MDVEIDTVFSDDKNKYSRKGNIFLNGKNVLKLSLKEFARKVAIVQQYNTSSDDITVERLIAFGRTPHRKMMQAKTEEDERLVEWAMEVTNLTEYRDRAVQKLSGGQRQRVWIAMALGRIPVSCFWMSLPHIWISDIRLRHWS